MNLMIISDGERGCGGRDFVRGLRVVFRETWNAPSYWDGNLRTSLSVSGDSINRGCPSKMGICVNMCFYQFQKPENELETPPSRSKFRDLFRHVFKFPTQVPIFEDTLCFIINSFTLRLTSLLQDKNTKDYYALKILTMAQVIKLKQVEHVINEKEILRWLTH